MIFHELQVRYVRQTGEEGPRKAKEIYLVEGATTFGDAEKCVSTEVQPFVFEGDIEVRNCKLSQFQEIFPNEGGAFWYKGRVELLTIDGDKETRKNVAVLVEANTIDDAVFALKQGMNSYDCELISIAKTQIMDIIHAVK